eukprot:1522295-Amphidinium_carterae.1
MSELKKATRRLTRHRACGSDCIPADLFLELPHSLLPEVLRLLQQITTQRVIPETWTRSIAVPLHKPGKPKWYASSYRFIGLTSSFLKLYEQMVVARLRRIAPPPHH